MPSKLHVIKNKECLNHSPAIIRNLRGDGSENIGVADLGDLPSGQPSRLGGGGEGGASSINTADSLEVDRAAAEDMAQADSGRVLHGSVDAVPLESTLALIEQILEAMSDSQIVSGNCVELYEETQDVYYPQGEKGELNGYIHSGFQGKNFHLLNGKFVPFMTFQKESIEMKIDEDLYPIFINEAAYYPQKLAFTLCRKKSISY